MLLPTKLKSGPILKVTLEMKIWYKQLIRATDLCSYIHEKAVARRKPDQLPFNEATYKDILEYLYSCLEHSIDSQITPTEQHEDSKRKFKLLREYVDTITAKNNHAISKLW